MKNLKSITGVFLMLIIVLFSITGCGSYKEKAPVSASGIKKVTAKIKPQSNGKTTEQNNIAKNIENDNKIGAIKHLYVISAMSGDVIIYSTVRGKVTSSGKRLTNTHEVIWEARSESVASEGFVLPKIQDNGTYGSSIPYLYWFDTKGVKHKHYVSGGQIIHISDQPIVVPKIIINMEAEVKVKIAPPKKAVIDSLAK